MQTEAAKSTMKAMATAKMKRVDQARTQPVQFTTIVALVSIVLCVAISDQSVDGFVVPSRTPSVKQKQLQWSHHRPTSSLQDNEESMLTTTTRIRTFLGALSTDEDISSSPKSRQTLNITATTNDTPTYISNTDVAALESSFQQPSAATLVPQETTTSITNTDNNALAAVGWRAVIVALCALWASNFAAAKMVMAVDGVDSSLYALSRFGVAAGALAPFAVSRWNKANMDTETLRTSIICGSWVAFGYLGQTLGLLTTTASKSCVICSMHCVFVATVAEFWRVQKANEQQSSMEDTGSASTQFNLQRLLPAAIAVIGVAIIELKGAGGAPTVGDALSFAQPIGFGMGYLILEDLMAKKPEAALPVSTIKLFVVAVASFLLFEVSPLLHQSPNDVGGVGLTIPDFGPILSSPVALGGILYTGLITTALALWVESIAFAEVPATDASLILTTEPLFAAGCGAIALGETFGMSDYVGASLIVGACALSIFLDDTDHHPHVSSEDGGGALAAAIELSSGPSSPGVKEEHP